MQCLNLKVIEDLPRDGYFASEMSWVLDSNKAMMNAMELYGRHSREGVCDAGKSPVIFPSYHIERHSIRLLRH